MAMNRRNVLIGLGAIAAGGGAAFGSGAFSQVQADREVQLDVTNDATAFVALNDHQNRDAVDSSSGALTIDLSSTLYTNGDGVNDDATIRIGEGGLGAQPGDTQGAFEIVNNTDGALDISVSPVANDVSGIEVFLNETTSATTASATSGNTATITGISSLENVEVAVEITTSGDAGTVTTNPQLTVDATQN